MALVFPRANHFDVYVGDGATDKERWQIACDIHADTIQQFDEMSTRLLGVCRPHCDVVKYPHTMLAISLINMDGQLVCSNIIPCGMIEHWMVFGGWSKRAFELVYNCLHARNTREEGEARLIASVDRLHALNVLYYIMDCFNVFI